MSLSVDLTTHGRELQAVYGRIIAGDPDSSWAVFSYDRGASNELKVQAQGSGELDEIVDEFSDGRISYGFVRVQDPNTRLNKFVLIGWCGEGVPEYKKGLFHSHFVAVSKFLKGYHVQITARNDADLDPAGIMKKIADASGSKYSQLMSQFETSPQTKRAPIVSPSVSAAFGRSSTGYKAAPVKPTKVDDDGWGEDAPPITATAPSIVPTKVDMAALRAGKSDTISTASSTNVPEVVKGGYQPVGKVDIAAIRAQAKQAAEYQQQSRQSPASPRQEKQERESTYVGTTGYTPVSLPKPSRLVTPTSFQNEPPKPVAPRFGQGAPRFRAGSGGGTVAPMPVGPKRESQALGGASKNFGADASGKTPSQLWAERKARERGMSASEAHVVPDISPATPLPTGPRRQESPPPGGYVEDSSEVIGKPVSGGVAAMRERFARQSLEEAGAPTLPISPTAVRGPPAVRRPSVSPPAPSPPAAPSPPPAAPIPPPIAISSKPPPKSYASIDDMVAAGVGAGVGLGVGAMAVRKDEPEEEPEHEAPAQQTWETNRYEPAEEEEDEEDLAARQRSRIAAEPEAEPEPKHEPERAHEPVSPTMGHKDRETGAENAQTAIVLFDYEAQEENEINLTEGQIITEVEIVDEGWWAGRDPSGNMGLFPSNYVELQESQPESLPSVPLSSAAETAHEDYYQKETVHEVEEDEGETALAEYDYEAQEDNELSFPEGAKITRIERVDENWWAGTYDGKEGLFPANYVTAQ